MNDKMKQELLKKLNETAARFGCTTWAVEPEWLEIGLRARFRCEYCGEDMLASIHAFATWQEDHIMPISAGGGDEIENKAVSCWICNSLKGRDKPNGSRREEWIESVKKKIGEKRVNRGAIAREFEAILKKVQAEN